MTGEEQILVLAPLWRDAEVICRVLTAANFDCVPCEDMEAVCRRMEEGAGALLVTEEALGEENRVLLLETLQSQEPWSDVPVTVLLAPGRNTKNVPSSLQAVVVGNNVTILRRPIPSTTLISIVNAALRARRRQYQLRAHLHQRQMHAELLEQRVIARTKRLQELSDRYQAARDLFFTLFQSNPLPIAIVRLKDGLVLDVNDALLRYFGAKRDTIVKCTTDELPDWLRPKERLQVTDRLRREGSVQNLETVTTHPSGETRTALLSAELVTIEGFDAALIAFVDISERKRAEEQIRELASQLTRAEHEERHRIAQILHDDLQQQLYGLQMQLTFLRDDASERVLQEIDAIEPMIQTAIKTVRDLSVDLSPPILHDEGLEQGIQWIAGRMREQYRMEVDLQAQGSFPVPDDGQRVLLFQILRELLFNAVKHAGVTSVEVTLRREGDEYRIDVVDEGAGFDPQQVLRDQGLAAGHGLISARQRLQLIGGRLKIESTPGQGTRATIYTPASHPA